MESILDKINQAYAKGINNPRFQEAIEEIIINPEKEETLEKSREQQSLNSKKFGQNVNQNGTNGREEMEGR